MSSSAIIVEQLGKRYKIGRRAQPARPRRGALRQVLTAHLQQLRLLSERGREDEFIWALRDACFEVQPGEVVGIIGRNGAGKSTLLKILSRVVRPTTGRAVLHGRIGSLLEVGTGFHSELTGRENVFLNGAILGMAQATIRRVFNDIVAFAELEKFIDTPVKRYSSGMYVRLAFAVAAHLEPEILLVDEVLAVGDIQFQRKCLGKMGTAAQSGRTILFVSHNLAAVEGLCQRGVVLEDGQIVFAGAVQPALGHYVRSLEHYEARELRDRSDRLGSGAIRFTSVSLRDDGGKSVPSFLTGRGALLELAFEARTTPPPQNLHVAVGISNSSGQQLAILSSEATGDSFSHVPSPAGVVTLSLRRLPLLPGRYHYNLYSTANGALADWIQNAGYFDVEAGDFYATGRLPPGGQLCLDGRFGLR
jgi:lipopolysaccharide transport system ATP-binding protein